MTASRPFVAVAEVSGWATLALLAWGGFRLSAGGHTLSVFDLGQLGAPWLLLLAAGLRAGALARLEDVPLLRRLRAGVRAAAAHPGPSLGVLAAAYAAALLALGFKSYAVHTAGAYDLGIFDQVVWATLHGAPLRSSIKGDLSILGDHFSPVLALLAPLYLLWDDPRCLLVVQTAAIAAGVVPAYRLARRRFDPPLALCFAAAYLAYPPTRNVNGYDFHPVALVIPLLLAAALWLEEGRTGWFLAALGLATCCQENVPLVVAGWGAALVAFRPRRPLLGATLAAAGLATFLLLVLVVIPRFGGAERFGYLSRYGHLGESLPAILRTLLTRPWLVLQHLVWPPPKIEYLLRVLGPLAFLPLLRGGWRWLLPVAPVLLQNTLARYPPMYSVAFQYTAPMTPFLFLGALDGARGLVAGRAAGPGPRWADARGVALLLAAALVLGGGESQVWQARLRRCEPRFAAIEPALAALPRDASVSAQAGVFSHLAHRHHAYLFPDRVGEADYVVLDRQGYLYRWQLSRPEYDELVAMLPARGYALALEQDGFLIFRRKGEAPTRPRRGRRRGGRAPGARASPPG